MNRLRVLVAVLTTIACSSTSIKDDASIDAGNDAQPDTDGGRCCADGLNENLTSQNATLGFAWTAWRHVRSCTITATSLEVPSDGPAVAILADTNGMPNTTLVPETPATAVGAGRVRASFSPVTLAAGTPVWIALKNSRPGIDGDKAPFAATGTPAKTTTAGSVNGPWESMMQEHYPIHLLLACP